MAKLDTPVKIRLLIAHAINNPSDATVFLKTYAQKVEDLLSEYRQAAHGKLVIEKFNPQPDSDAEDFRRDWTELTPKTCRMESDFILVWR